MTAPERLRIALLTPGMSADEQDWCIPVQLDFVRHLARAHDVTVFPLRYPHHREPYSVYGASVLPAGGAGVRGPGRLLLYRRVLSLFRRQHRRTPFHLVQAFWAHEPGFLAALAGRWARIPVVVSIFGGELADVPEVDYGGRRQLINRHLTARALLGADRVLVGSRFIRRQAAADVDAGRLLTLPLGVELGRFTPHGSETGEPSLEGSPCLLHAGSLIPVKDQATLLEAFAAVARELTAAHLHVLGDGPLRPQLEDLGRQPGIAARVHWHRDIAHDRLPAFYRAADLCVVTSHSELYPMVALEAAACGRLTLGTAVGKLPELVDPARLTRPGDAASLAHQLLETLRDPERLVADGLAARRRVEAELDLGKQVGRYVELYRQLIAERGETASRAAGARLRANLAQLALLAVDQLPARFVTTDAYRRLRRALSSTPLRFEPPEPPVEAPPRGRWHGRRLADRATNLVIEGFPGSANSYVSNCLRDALERPAILESHFHYTAQLERALAFGVPAVVVIREPSAACASLQAKEPGLLPSICLLRWIAYHRVVLRHRRRLHLAFFDDVAQDIDVLRRSHPAVARLVAGKITPNPAYRRPSPGPAGRRADSFLSAWLLSRAERLYRALRRSDRS